MIKFSNRSRETANDWQPIHFVQPIIQPGPLCSNLATDHNSLPTNHFDRVTHQQQQQKLLLIMDASVFLQLLVDISQTRRRLKKEKKLA